MSASPKKEKIRNKKKDVSANVNVKETSNEESECEKMEVVAPDHSDTSDVGDEESSSRSNSRSRSATRLAESPTLGSVASWTTKESKKTQRQLKKEREMKLKIERGSERKRVANERMNACKDKDRVNERKKSETASVNAKKEGVNVKKEESVSSNAKKDNAGVNVNKTKGANVECEIESKRAKASTGAKPRMKDASVYVVKGMNADRPTSLDRVKGGKDDVYVVKDCLVNEVRKIDPGVCDSEIRVKEEPQAACDPLARLQKTEKNILGILLSEANKVPRYVADKVMGCFADYKDTVHRTILENERMRGRLEVHERMESRMKGAQEAVKMMAERVKGMNESMSGLCERVNVLSEKVEAPRPIEQSTASAGSGSMNVRKNERSYAVIVKGKNEEFSVDEVKKRMNEVVNGGANVRVRMVKPVRGGGVVIETPSDADRRVLSQNAGLAEAGLLVEEPRRIDPRVIVYDVPNLVTNECFLHSVYEKSLNGMISESEFCKRVRVVKFEPSAWAVQAGSLSRERSVGAALELPGATLGRGTGGRGLDLFQGPGLRDRSSVLCVYRLWPQGGRVQGGAHVLEVWGAGTSGERVPKFGGLPELPRALAAVRTFGDVARLPGVCVACELAAKEV